MTLTKLKQWAQQLKQDAVAVYYAARDQRTPMAARLLAMAVAAYAFSPIDLIPDFIPVIGYLDDLLIVPLGLMLVIKLIPAPVLADARDKALRILERPRSNLAAIVVIVVWIVCIMALVRWLF